MSWGDFLGIKVVIFLYAMIAFRDHAYSSQINSSTAQEGDTMSSKIANDQEFESYDEILGKVGDPKIAEDRLKVLAAKVKDRNDQSTYIEALSQIALVQALQQKYAEAFATIDSAEKLLPKANSPLAKAMLLLEKARVIMQSDEKGRYFQPFPRLGEVNDLFTRSYELSKESGLDAQAINAAHMLAIVAPDIQGKIHWNELCLAQIATTKDPKAHLWAPSIYNNLGQNYLETKMYPRALEMFEKALSTLPKDSPLVNTRMQKWNIAKALRLNNETDQAVKMQEALMAELESIERTGKLDLPPAAFSTFKAWIKEELAENYLVKAKSLATQSYGTLKNDPAFAASAADRLERLAKLKDLL